MAQIIWQNGDWTSPNSFSLPPNDRGLTLGDGVFDTMLAKNDELIMGKDHMERLIRHTKAIHIKIPHTVNELLEVAKELIEKNGTDQTYAIRTTVTRGSGMRGINISTDAAPHIYMMATPVTLSDEPKPVRLMISKTVMRNEFAPSSFIKSTNYLDNILAKEEAIQAGYDDALLLNTKGHVTCATTSNVFFEKDEQLYTPPLVDGVMDGTQRQHIIDTKGAIEQTITAEQIKDFDGAFLTNSILGIVPIKQIEQIVLL